MMEHEGHVVEGCVSQGTTSPKASVSQSVKGANLRRIPAPERDTR